MVTEAVASVIYNISRFSSVFMYSAMLLSQDHGFYVVLTCTVGMLTGYVILFDTSFWTAGMIHHFPLHLSNQGREPPEGPRPF